MHKGLLIYRFPESKDFTVQSGNWVFSNEIKPNAFFVTEFSRAGCFIFEEATSIAISQSDKFITKKELTSNSFISESNYLKNLSQLLDEMNNSKTEKVVLSRIIPTDISDANDLEKLLNRLAGRYKQKALIYAISSPDFGTWVGATPEIMLAGSPQHGYRTMSLAGTKKQEDTEWTMKEEREQAIVTDFILEKLKDSKARNVITDGPKTFFTGAVYHLRTDVHFLAEVRQLPSLISSLHPTPAVCGIPRNQAFDLIHQFEGHERSLYTGMIGIFGEDHTSIYVNLRCMQLLNNQKAAIYVGGGITLDSSPKDEWQETENKANTLRG